MPSSIFSLLRSRANPELSRVQDSINGVLEPVAQALMTTPIMGAASPSWIGVDLLNGFANTGGGLATTAYHKDALGYFHGKGVLTHAAGCAAGTAICTLPMGYRPRETQRFAVCGDTATAQFLSVTPAGVVSVEVAIAAGGTCDFAFMFLTEQ